MIIKESSCHLPGDEYNLREYSVLLLLTDEIKKNVANQYFAKLQIDQKSSNTSGARGIVLEMFITS